MKDEIENVKRKLLKPAPVSPVLTKDMFLSSGSTILNMAASGKPYGCFIKGHFYMFVGDSDSGKTFITLTCFAEATINKNFDDYRLIYDATELGALMDFQKFFGKAVAERVEAPAKDKDGNPLNSSTVQEFYYNVDDAIKLGKPFIYVLDSQDGLSSKEEISKFQQHKKAYRKKQSDDGDGDGKKPAGSFGDRKAQHHSEDLRKLMGPLEKSGSILIMIGQTRDSFSLFEKSTFSGGRSLKFYATLLLWSTCAGKIGRTVKGKERQLGVECKVRVKKNRVTGRDRSVVIPIFHSFGLDETGSMVDYLVDEKVWKSNDSGIVKVIGLGPPFEMRKEPLIRKIEEEDMVDDVRSMVVQTWNDIEEACVVPRNKRYE